MKPIDSANNSVSLMIAPDISREDAHLWYSQCYISRYVDKIYHPLEIREVNSNPRGVTISTMDLVSREGKSYNITDPELDWTYPDLGLINLPKCVVNLSRRMRVEGHAKYVRALYLDNLSFNWISPVAVSKTQRFRKIKLSSIDCLKYLFNPVYYTLPEAYDKLITYKSLVVAINPNWAIGIDYYINDICLYYKDSQLAGFVKSVNNELIINLFKEFREFEQQLSELNLEVQVDG